MEYKEIIKNSYYHDNTGMLLKGDCLEVMKNFPDHSINMILCDLPYGTTQCKWDTIIPFEPLWEQYKRIIKDDGAIVLAASQPFTSALIMSNPDMFKYEWVWQKTKSAGFFHAHYRPLKIHENILVFSNGSSTYSNNKNNMIYNPQMKNADKIIKPNKGSKVRGILKEQLPKGRIAKSSKDYDGSKRFPTSIFLFSQDVKKLHPTQKPVALFEYLIETYTNENNIILDNAAGSCTTAIACKNTNRKWICIEQELKYCDISVDRIKNYAKTT